MGWAVEITTATFPLLCLHRVLNEICDVYILKGISSIVKDEKWISGCI